MQAWVRRLVAVAVVVVAAGSAAGQAAATPARIAVPGGAQGAAAHLFALVNAERASAGVAPLAWRDDVAGIAEGWSASMRDAGALSHNDEYFSDETRDRIGSRTRAENVASAHSIEAAHAGLMGSPSHAANIFDPGLTEAGFAAVLDGAGRWWVTQDFLQPASGARTAPAPEPTPEPEPEHEPGPEPAPPPPAPEAPPAPPGTTPPSTTPVTAPPETAPLAPIAINSRAAAGAAPVAPGTLAAPADRPADPGEAGAPGGAAVAVAAALVLVALGGHLVRFPRRARSVD